MTSRFIFSLVSSLLILISFSLVSLLRSQKMSVHYRLGFLGFGMAFCIGSVSLFIHEIIPTTNIYYSFIALSCWLTALLYISLIIDITSVRRSPYFWTSYLLPIPLALLTVVLPRPVGVVLIIIMGDIILAGFSLMYLINWIRSATDERARRDGEWLLMVFIAFGIGLIVSIFNALDGLFWVLSLWFLVVYIAVNHLKILNQLTGQENLVIIDNIFDIVFILDVAGRIVRMNRRAFQITGYSSVKVYGNGIEKIVIHPELSQDKRATWLKKYNWFDSGSSTIRGPSIDAWISSDNGEEVPIDLRVIALQDLRKRITGYILSATDLRITRQLMKEISDREYAARGLGICQDSLCQFYT